MEETLSREEMAGVRTRRLLALAVFCGYVLLSVLVYLPIGPFDHTHLPGGGLRDPGQMTWFLAYGAYAVSHGHNPFFTTALDYPLGVNLATNTSVPLLSVVASPLTLAIGPIATLNALLRLSLALSAFSLYAVLGRFRLPAPSRALGGLLYGFGPYLIGQASGNAHLDLAFGALLPPLFLLVYELASGAPGGSSLRRGLLLGVVVAAQFLIAPEILAESLVLLALALIVVGVVHWRAARARWRELVSGAATALACAGALLAWPISVLLGGAQHLSGPVQPLAKLQVLSADLVEPILPTAREALRPFGVGSLVHYASKDASELGGYLALPIVALLVVVAVRQWRDPLVRALGLVGLGGFLLSLGGELYVDGHQSMALPESLLTHLPLLDNLVPARFGVEVALCFAALVAVGLGRMGSLPLPERLGRLALVGLGLALLVPKLPLSERAPVWPVALPKAVTSPLPPRAVVLAYPYPTPPQVESMVWQAESEMAFSLLGGYASVPGPGGTGQYWPQLLADGDLQRFFAFATTGPRSHFNPVATPSAAAFCAFVDRYHVTDVIAWPHGAQPRLMTTELQAVLGAPRVTAEGVSLYPTSSCETGR